jgi:hypothetical protein
LNNNYVNPWPLTARIDFPNRRSKYLAFEYCVIAV